MCGIAGYIVRLDGGSVPHLKRALAVQAELIAHRGPDGEAFWLSPNQNCGLAHRRLAIIDLTATGAQPMHGPNGTVVTHNGEIYNYRELRAAFADRWSFRTESDTECILACYDIYGEEFLTRLRGMFAFVLFDERRQRLIAARDRFGIKPLYYAAVDGVLYFASEVKALLPFLPDIETDPGALAEYLTFQYTIGSKDSFKHVHQLLPGHYLVAENGRFETRRYWDVRYDIDGEHNAPYFERRLRELLNDSVSLHLRADVPVGAYISGGIDSSLMAILAAKLDPQQRQGFHGRFTDYPGYDESAYARTAAEHASATLNVLDITAKDFIGHIRDVIWHLDFPVGGPGSFPQFMVSELAAEHVKVVLGGQGGDEIFGGYARYLVAYFEQCIKAAIEGNYKNGNFVVTIKSIVPNLGVYANTSRCFASSGAKACFPTSTVGISGSSIVRAIWPKKSTGAPSTRKQSSKRSAAFSTTPTMSVTKPTSTK